MENFDWSIAISAISGVIGLGALIVSIVAICSAKKMDKQRKLKDTIINEVVGYSALLWEYIKPLIENKKMYSCQNTITWFKFAMMKLDSILNFVEKSVEGCNSHYAPLKQSIHTMRTIITDDLNFKEAVSKKHNYDLDSASILQIEQEYAKFYELMLTIVGTVNASKCKNFV